MNFIGTNLIKITNNQIIMHALYFRFFVLNIFDKNKNRNMIINKESMLIYCKINNKSFVILRFKNKDK